MTTAKDLIAKLNLKPHPEGGYFAETFRDAPNGDRGYSTAIYYLLEAGDLSAWHRVNDAAEVWHFYAGDPLVITLSPDGHDATSIHLGSDVMAGQQPQVVVPAGHWQTAETLGRFTLVGCTVAPGFEFAGFEMAPADWRPTPRDTTSR
ncbi:cupin domain-containing protein [Acuticoccus sp. MNP-M23]|uniref:cupin domain-containing protein n=1 Tax=Acuticoccus sp. MNP-M23 TaxID=3072793 RepID=UPI002815E17C|nr:cupin domain-containing protein [Acuticoccus sp. MNP-M23]WMS42886.1 cupin domain-containing protein [Acuticoccus sp. MNP-M23]